MNIANIISNVDYTNKKKNFLKQSSVCSDSELAIRKSQFLNRKNTI